MAVGMDKFVVDECETILLEIEPDLALLAVFAVWDAEPLPWSGKDILKP